jgi:phytanoyl-CoA hydroxylase
MPVDLQLKTELPALDFSLEEVQKFHELGYAIARNLGSESLRDRMLQVTRAGLQGHIAPVEYESDLNYPGAPRSLEEVGGRTIRRLKQAFSRDSVFTEWLTQPSLLNRLKQLLGPQVVCPLAHHNCIMTKEPQFSSDTGWHQDIRYWSFQQPDLISAWLALGPERAENGCLQVIPGSHRQKFPPESFDRDLFFRSDLPANEPVLEKRILVELNAGDVLFFHAKTLHAATRNFSQQTKYSVVFTFRSAENLPLVASRSASFPELLLH